MASLFVDTYKTRWLLVLFMSSVCVAQSYDDIDSEMDDQIMMRVIRAAVNQTKADTLNLPSNATSIRENITDNFSCEGLPYGYYADVENECQIFHVCLPSQAPSGRSTTYRWSFICPEETVFNQEVLVCTRPREAIDCEDSPMYYDKNMDIGKLSNDTSNEMTAAESPQNQNEINKEFDKKNKKQQQLNKRPENKRKHNIVVDSSMRHKAMALEDFKNKKGPQTFDGNSNSEFDDLNTRISDPEFENERDVYERISEERSLKNNPKIIKRGGLFRFKADVV